MRYLKPGFLVLSSHCNGLTTPGGTFDLSLPSSNEFVDIFPHPGLLTPPNKTTLLNSTGAPLGLPIDPAFYPDYRPYCTVWSGRPFKGGQLIYSLLSELSEIWKSTDNPTLREPMRARNVPFYSIEIAVVPAGSTLVLLTRTKLAVYVYRLVKGLVGPAVSQWPGAIHCRLKVEQTRFQLGKLDVSFIPITALGADPNSTGNNTSSNGYTADTALANGITSTFVGNAKLGADGIDIHQSFRGTKTTDKNALFLFTNVLLPLFGRDPKGRLTNILPPGRLSSDVTSSDGTFRIRMQTYPAAAVWAFTLEEFHEGLMRLLLLMAVEDRWESMIGGIIKDGNTVASVYLDPVRGSSADGSGQNWNI